MIRVKDDTINVSHLSPALILAIMVANEVYAAYGYELVLTSGLDGKHSHTSLHYNGEAVDLRTRHIIRDDEKRGIRDDIKECLGRNFDVILESDHIHLEHQPRRPLA